MGDRGIVTVARKEFTDQIRSRKFLVLVAILLLVAAMIGWSMAAGNFLVPVLAIPLGVIVIYACRRNVKEVIADERLNKVRSQAALRILEVTVIAGSVIAVILCSFMVSSSLIPRVTGSVYMNADGTSSMVINLCKPGSPENPENLVRTVTIPDIDSMNEYEALQYSQFRREAYLENERNGLAGMTIGFSLAALLGIFGAFYVYYEKKHSRQAAMKNRIKVLRAERTLTREQLAELIGVTRNTIISIEKDKYCPSLKLGYRIAAVFGVGIDDVFTYEPDKDGPSEEPEES